VKNRTKYFFINETIKRM